MHDGTDTFYQMLMDCYGIWSWECMMMTSSIVNSYFNQYPTDMLGFDSGKGLWIASFAWHRVYPRGRT